MPDTTITLKIFNKDELLLSDQQTREALKFFFPAKLKEIDSYLITDNTKNFAQGLLVEAIDLTYKIAYVVVLWETIKNQVKYRKKISQPVKSFVNDVIGNSAPPANYFNLR